MPSAPASALRERLRSGGPLVGTFVKLPALESVDIVAGAGFDLVLVDGEHAQLDEAACLALVRHAAALGLPAVVRIPAIDPGYVNRLLEAGAAGIQLSTVRARGERDALVSATRYPPDGTRSVSLAHPAAQYGGVPIAEYLERSRAGWPLLVGQIETATTVDPLTDLLPGLDVAFIGTTDLSVDLGKPGLLEDERVRARVAEIASAAERASVALGAWVPNADMLKALGGMKLRYVVVGSELQVMRAGLASALAATRAALH